MTTEALRDLVRQFPSDRRLRLTLAGDPRARTDAGIRKMLLARFDHEVVAQLLPALEPDELDGVLRGYEEIACDHARDAEWVADWALALLRRANPTVLRALPRARFEAWLSAEDREQRLAAMGLLADWVRLQSA